MRPLPFRRGPDPIYPFRWKAVLVVCTVYALFTISHAFTQDLLNGGTLYSWQNVVFGLVDGYQWAVYIPVVFRLAGRYPLQRPGLAVSLTIHFFAGSAVSLLATTIDWVVMTSWSEEPMPYPAYAGVAYHLNLMVYMVVLGTRYALDYYRAYRDREALASRLEMQLVKARLTALQMQIQPHFLFNVLNTIAEVMHHDLQLADRMMSQLGELLRVTFERPSSDTVPLRSEIQFLRAYLELEKARFPDRLTVDIEVSPDAEQAEVPNFILQPLVENAIRHGVARSRNPGHIGIRAVPRGDRLHVEVTDNGAGLAEKPRGRTGVGLANVSARLAQLYGRHHRFEVRNRAEGGVAAMLEIPLRHFVTEPPAPTPALGAGAS
ncbi:MAG TPA: histidine kinase [Longimicrobiaceae bacterium]|nr:histidine kinase [Longimicrobiaceae bacterium]